jgi:hypothetical protein
MDCTHVDRRPTKTPNDTATPGSSGESLSDMAAAGMRRGELRRVQVVVVLWWWWWCWVPTSTLNADDAAAVGSTRYRFAIVTHAATRRLR